MSGQGEANRNCRQCRYARSDLVPGQQVLFCTRFPPQVVFVPGDMRNMPGINAMYPQVQPDIPCGEWRPASEAPSVVSFTPEPSGGGIA